MITCLRIENDEGYGPFWHSKKFPEELREKIYDSGNEHIKSPWDEFKNWKWRKLSEDERKKYKFAFSKEEVFWRFCSDFLSELVFYGFNVIELTLNEEECVIGEDNIIFQETAVIKKQIILQ